MAKSNNKDNLCPFCNHIIPENEKKKKPHHKTLILPKGLYDWVMNEIEEGDYTFAEYFRKLVRDLKDGKIIPKDEAYDLIRELKEK